MKNLKLLLFSLMIVFMSCFGNNDDDEINGCTDNNALNYDSLANNDDGSCRYSQATFYSKYNLISGIPVTKIDISIQGEYIGSINNGFIWPNGPGNCSSNGTVNYQFNDSERVDWNADIFLANGSILSSSGTRSPSSFIECIKISVIN